MNFTAMQQPALFPSPLGIFNLSPREIQIMNRMYLPDKLIADDMNISPHTVSTYLEKIRIKTGYRSKIELAIYATKQGYIL